MAVYVAQCYVVELLVCMMPMGVSSLLSSGNEQKNKTNGVASEWRINWANQSAWQDFANLLSRQLVRLKRVERLLKSFNWA